MDIKQNKPPGNGSNEKLLKELRAEIDLLDAEILKLLKERIIKTRKVGGLKKLLLLPSYSPEREKEILNKISSGINNEGDKKALLSIYERIIDVMRAVQKVDKGDL
jgi:chorismate mutase